jgi:hypothetical protein
LVNTNPNSQVPLKPAPWQLTGNGFILVYWFSKSFLLKSDLIPPGMMADFRGGPSVVVLVNYHRSDVGPYYELLFMPGRFEHKGQQFSSITKIYVSTEASVVNGRKNWAIPKEIANFDWQIDEDGLENVQVRQRDQTFANFMFQPFGPTLPASTGLIPPGWRTVMQPGDTHLLFTKLQSSGKVKLARCRDVEIDGNFFPNLTRGRLLVTCKVSQFDMIFPVATLL